MMNSRTVGTRVAMAPILIASFRLRAPDESGCAADWPARIGTATTGAVGTWNWNFPPAATPFGIGTMTLPCAVCTGSIMPGPMPAGTTTSIVIASGMARLLSCG
eukprot:6993136-Prymnesium_polylepis.1